MAIAVMRVAIGGVAISVVRVAIGGVAISVMRIGAIASELRAIAGRRQTIRGLKIAHKVTLVGKSDAKTDLLHAEKA